MRVKHPIKGIGTVVDTGNDAVRGINGKVAVKFDNLFDKIYDVMLEDPEDLDLISIKDDEKPKHYRFLYSDDF